MDETRFPPEMSVLFSIFEAAIYRNFLKVFLCFGRTEERLADDKRQSPSCIERSQTHVLCKPTHFFFQLLIDRMSNYIQTSFTGAMKDWTDKYHLWGTPTRSLSWSNSR